jgi:hypothetical protein
MKHRTNTETFRPPWQLTGLVSTLNISMQYTRVAQVQRQLDAPNAFADGLGVDSPSMKVVGRLDKTPWQRFARLQRMAAKLARGRGQPKGLFRFHSNEACDAWTKSLNRTAK